MIWLIGAGGMLGKELGNKLCDGSVTWSGSDRSIDITDVELLRAHARELQEKSGQSISWIINCAAYTAVDKAEDEVDLCRLLNVVGPHNIATVAQEIGAALLHISTDYVFDGKCIQQADGRVRAYREQDPIDPQGVYGKTKAEGEAEIARICSRHVIVRTAWLYGQYGPNFVFTMLRLMSQRDSLGVVADQHGSPTWTADLSDAILKIVSRSSPTYGIWHYSGEGSCSWYEFATEIYRLGKEQGILTKDVALNPLTTDQYPTKARRPAWSLLSKDKLRADFELPVPDWHESLASFIHLIKEKGIQFS